MLSLCRSACSSQALVAAFEDFKAAVEESKRPVHIVGSPAPATIASKPRPAPIAPAAQPALTKELAAKDKTIESKEAALASKEMEITSMRGQLNVAIEEKTKSMQAIIDGAKAQGVCMHLHLHLQCTIHHSVICFHAFLPQVVPTRSQKSLPTCVTKT